MNGGDDDDNDDERQRIDCAADFWMCDCFVTQVLEEKLTSLPWLEQKREAERKQEEEERNKNPGAFGLAPPGTWKPYVSGMKFWIQITGKSTFSYPVI